MGTLSISSNLRLESLIQNPFRQRNGKHNISLDTATELCPISKVFISQSYSLQELRNVSTSAKFTFPCCKLSTVTYFKNCKTELLAKSLNHRYSGHSKEKEAKLSRPWTRAVFQYPQKSSSAQGWQVQGGCHSAGWQPIRGKESNMKVAGGPSLSSLSLSIHAPNKHLPFMERLKDTVATQLFKQLKSI